MYRPTTIARAEFNNSVRLQDLVKDGKIYLSLSDAIALALENNYDIAIARYYLDIADTDVLRAKAGGSLRGVGATVLQNTIGGTSQTLSSSGAPGAYRRRWPYAGAARPGCRWNDSAGTRRVARDHHLPAPRFHQHRPIQLHL
jgi:hypothetical protein